MKKILLLALLASTSVYAQTDKLVAKLNGIDIKESDLLLAEEEVGTSTANMPEPQKREFLLNFVIDLNLASKAAEVKGIDKTPAFMKKLAYSKQKLLVESFLDNEAKAKVTPAAVQKTYDDEIKKMKVEEEVSARHILVKTEEEAKDLIKKIQAGGDFSALAKEFSTDTGSGAEGGKLGYFTKDKMVAEFSDAAFKLKKDEVSAPIKSQFGYHIIKQDDKRMQELPKLESVKPQIEEFLLRKSQQELITGLRATAKIEKIEEKKEEKK